MRADQITIDETKLGGITLAKGEHGTPEEGLCLMHNGRLVTLSMDSVVRFAEYRRTVSGSKCLRWTGSVMHRGYGQFHWAGLAIRAHRFAYQATHGPVGAGDVIDHECHNVDLDCPGGDECLHRLCVNPEHLRATSHQGNLRASNSAPSTQNLAKTQCPQGHVYGGNNVRFRSSGARRCAQCYRDRAAAYFAVNRDAINARKRAARAARRSA